MKKIAILILSILIAGLFVACNQEVTIDAQTYANIELGTFVLNGQNYATLQAAIDALSGKAIGNEPGVIYLTKDASGPGAVIDGIEGVKIDFGEYTYSFTNVTATQGSTDGNFGLAIKGGSSVTLAGTKAMNLFDNTTGLTMVYVEGATTSLAVEQAPQMTVADDQFVFWAANGATLTIGGETKVSGGVAATGTEDSIPRVVISTSNNSSISTLKASSASIEPTGGNVTVASLQASDNAIISASGEAGFTVTHDDSGNSSYSIQNTGTGTVKNESTEINSGKSQTVDSGVKDIVVASVARIGTTGYTTLADAITAGNGKTIILVSDIGEDITSSGNITIDLNGKTVGSESSTVEVTLPLSGTLKIENGSQDVGTVFINYDNSSIDGTLSIVSGIYNVVEGYDLNYYVSEGYEAVERRIGDNIRYVVRIMPLEVGFSDNTPSTSIYTFARSVNNGLKDFSNVTVSLLKDVDMSGIIWKTPIGTNSNPFNGSFDGQGYSILNLSNQGYPTTVEFTNATSQTTGKIFGLFGYVQGTVSIKNLKLSVNAVYAEGKSWAGLVAVSGYNTPDKRCDLTIKDVTVSGTIEGNDKVAGFVGQSPYDTGVTGKTTFIDCVNNANVVAINRAAGFLASAGGSFIDNKLTFTNCTNNGNIKATGSGKAAAGICSSVNQANSAGVAVKDQLSISTTEELFAQWNKPTFEYTNCVNTGSISGTIAYSLFCDLGTYSTGTGVFTYYDYNNEPASDSCGLYFAYLNTIGVIEGHERDWKATDHEGNPNYDVLWKGIQTAYVNEWDPVYAREVFNTLTLGADYTNEDIIIIEQYGGKYVFAYYSGQGKVSFIAPNTTADPTRDSLLEAINDGYYLVKSTSIYHDGQTDEAVITIYQQALEV